MSQAFCQSCGMPLGDEHDMYGTEADQGKSADYCKFCYQNGEFSADMTMEQMIDFCAPHMANAGQGMSEAEAKNQMRMFFPKLKRWSK